MMNIVKDDKRHLLNDVSRLLRGSLNALLIAADALQHTSLEKHQAQCLELIVKSATSLCALPESFDEYSVLSEREWHLFEAELDINNLLLSLNNEYQDMFETKGLTLTTHYGWQFPSVKAHGYFILQILRNLLDYLLEHTFEGALELKVVIEEQLSSLQFVLDITGLSLRPELQASLVALFDNQIKREELDFTQAHPGLSLAAKLTQCLHGSLSLISNDEEYTSFTLNLPVELLNQPAANFQFIAPPSVVSKEIIRLKNKKALKVFILEDDNLSQHALKLLLENYYNCQITSAYTVTEALAKMSDEQDILLIDMNLPDGTGLEFIEIFRESFGQHIPIIVITAHASDEQQAHINEYDVTDIIVKPATRETLIEAIETYVFDN